MIPCSENVNKTIGVLSYRNERLVNFFPHLKEWTYAWCSHIVCLSCVTIRQGEYTFLALMATMINILLLFARCFSHENKLKVETVLASDREGTGNELMLCGRNGVFINSLLSEFRWTHFSSYHSAWTWQGLTNSLGHPSLHRHKHLYTGYNFKG